MISREKEAKDFRLFVCSILSLSLSIRKKPIVAFPVTWLIMTRIKNSPTDFEKIYAALPEQLEVNIKICSCWINFDSQVIAIFTGIADDYLIPLVLNKFDKKTQRQLAEIWSYGWMLHGVIFCRTQLRKHHKVLYNRGNELQKFLDNCLSNCAFFNKIFLFRSIHYLYKCSSVLQECYTVFNCRQHRIRLNPVLLPSFERPAVLPR